MGANIPQIRLFRTWLAEHRGRSFPDYEALWRWSVTDLEGFWQAVWDYHELESPTPHRRALASERMPGAVWFEGAQVNYARQVLRHAGPAHAANQPAIISEDERGQVRELSWPELQRQVASLALTLRDLGVERGDSVVAYLPNIPETVVSMLACASLGAIWSVCAPDMGTPAVVDRFHQISPKVMIAADGVFYGGKALDRSATVAALRQALPTLSGLILLTTPYAAGAVPAERTFAEAIGRSDDEVSGFAPEPLPFDHPLWVLYSSGTTGLPKPIVHSQGGVIVSALVASMQMDVGASYSPNTLGERCHWHSSTGWVLWNVHVAALLGGATICLFDGSPSGARDNPYWGVLWRFAARHKATYFGAGAAYYANCMKAGLSLAEQGNLSRIRVLGSTGSPLPAAVQAWGSGQFADLGSPDVWWCNISGGTDICGNFLTGNREAPPAPGKLQCRQLGAAVEAWDENGRALVGEVGELVCTRPLPSMPIYLWGDQDGVRYRASYFDAYPGVWRHGDWLRVDADGTCTISGRSDATINRNGVRMGTSEIYAAVEQLPEVLDSMAIELERGEGESFLLLFVVLRAGETLSEALSERIAAAVRGALSPRFVPDQIIAAPAIPRTLSGKKQELPMKRLIQGWPLERVVNREAMANPEVLAWYDEQRAANFAWAASHSPFAAPPGSGGDAA